MTIKLSRFNEIKGQTINIEFRNIKDVHLREDVIYIVPSIVDDRTIYDATATGWSIDSQKIDNHTLISVRQVINQKITFHVYE